MKKLQNRLRKRIYPIIWSGIIVVSVYLIIRFAVLSFSDNVGQADSKLSDAIFSGLCCKVVESGSSLISYSANTEHNIFPIGLLADGLALDKYTKEASSWTMEAQAYSNVPVNPISSDTEDSAEAMNSNDIHNELRIYEVSEQYLSMEYVLTNGAVFNSEMVEDTNSSEGDQLQIGYEDGEVYYEDDASSAESTQTTESNTVIEFTADQLKDVNFLVKNFYIVDSSTKVTNKVFDAEKLTGMDMTMKQDSSIPQILIYHTHSQEAFIDSRAGHPEDTVVGVGTYLTDILENDYGYNVIHDTTTYDIVDGKLDRSYAYSVAEDGLDKTLSENPSIEVVIDLHRDSGDARTINVDGRETARIMLFNGLSRDQNGPISYLENPNLQGNLAFSLQLQLKSYELYPKLFCKNYLKSYRYNLNVRPKSILMELGTEGNTLESAKNAMAPFAKVLDHVLKGE